MQTKLTLRLDEALIRQAKAYASRTGKSLSQIVAEYLQLLAAEPREREPLAPIVAELKGALRSSGLDREEYLRYLEEKHR